MPAFFLQVYLVFCGMKKTILITGASSGIGEACAHAFAAAGHHIIITARRQDLLDALAEKLQSAYQVKVLPLCFDVSKREEVFNHLTTLPEAWQDIDILINNAGLALGRDPFDKASIDDWDTMMHTNVDGLLYVSRAVLPYMISRKKGHIINIGSIAGKQVYENGNVYCASKAAVDSISQSMRIDLLPHGIKVTGIHPGAVETNFSLVRFKGDAGKASAAYQGYIPLSAKDVADTVFYCASLPGHVCINDLTITCLQQADAIYFYKNQG